MQYITWACFRNAGFVTLRLKPVMTEGDIAVVSAAHRRVLRHIQFIRVHKRIILGRIWTFTALAVTFHADLMFLMLSYVNGCVLILLFNDNSSISTTSIT